MLKNQIFFVLLVTFISLSQSFDFKWDKNTPYAHFYDISQTRATKNTKDTIRYLLTSQGVPQGSSKVTMKVRNYGDPKSPTAHTLMFGLITQDNKNNMAVYWDKYSLLIQSVYVPEDVGFGRICYEDHCHTYSSQVFIPAGKTVQFTFDATLFTAKFYIPKSGKSYQYNFVNKGWQNKNLYLFFQSTHMGGEIEVQT